MINGRDIFADKHRIPAKRADGNIVEMTSLECLEEQVHTMYGLKG
jgi:hypothetical protein